MAEIHQHYPDPMNDARRELTQGAAMISTVLEAGARWVAVGLAKEAADKEQEAGRIRKADAMRERAEAFRAGWLRERERLAEGIDTKWLTEEATFAQAASVWRTASAHLANGDKVGERLVKDAMDRMRQLQPDLMARYDRERAHHDPGTAMRNVYQQMWEENARANGQPRGPRARPHPGREDPALAGLDKAVGAEIELLSRNASPATLGALQQQWRDAGEEAAAGRLDRLREACVPDGEADNRDQLGDAARKQGRSASGGDDDPRTAHDEHSAGQRRSVTLDDTADGLEAQAARQRNGPVHVGVVVDRPLASQGFANKLSVGAIRAEVAGKKPAESRPRTETRGRTR
ncbi:hypothetical protein ACTI_37790 [Actinoplanes sp. OR16]|uniref:hypothetical protein n=1 Tax=Actinoplanes sp. OR16 TaxID=946334 RepID=UPI000F6F6DBD|nr:hypothetical protein [Actinoplanes sp. OR16]BBH67094.1 hypothetical protein ACTI_37790 [Actinoplanes sp. OR16]